MNEKTISHAVALLRFPLMVAIVCIHSDLRVACPTTSTLSIFSPFIQVFKNDICFPVLDVFFFISGFYFFRECRLDTAVYAVKLRKRFKSLFIPYMLWNGITFIAVCLCQVFTGHMPLLHKAVIDFRWYDYLLVFWDQQAATGIASDPHGPLVLQFWFVQCLMVAMLLSPILWLGVRRLGWLFLVLLAILLLGYPFREYAGIRMDALLFFAMGAYFRLHQRLWSVLAHPWALASSWSMVWIAMQFLPHLSLVYCTLYVLLVLSLAAHSQYEVPPTLGKAAFFIFAFHIFISQAFLNISGKLPIPWNNVLAFVAFFTMVAVNVCLCLLGYYLMKGYMPKLLSLLVGGRL